VADIVGANGQRADFRVIGKPNLPGKASYALASGIAKFGIDYTMPNMLHAKFLRSPYANARVLSVDISKASQLEGVVEIITWEDEDIKNLTQGVRPWLDNYADREGIEVAVIVVAESLEICDEALRLMDIQWEVLPHVVEILEGIKPDAPIVRPPGDMFHGPESVMQQMAQTPNGKPKRGNVSFCDFAQGDADKAMEEAEDIIAYSLMLPGFASHIPNPPASIAWWGNDPYRGSGLSLFIEGAVQRREHIARMYGVAEDRTIQEGIFQGGKYCDWGMRRAQEITPLLAKRTGRPVRCADTREDTFEFQMNQRYIHMKVGHTQAGLITAIDDYSIADGGIFKNASFGTTGDQRYGPYYTLKCKDIKQSMEVVDSNRGKMYLSGQHCPFNWDSVTMAIYLIAEKLGKDPIDIAKLNLHGPDSQDDDRPVPSFEACLEAGKQLMNWQWHAAGTKRLPDGRYHGQSFRYQICPRHAFSGYKCKIELRDGVIRMPSQGPLYGVYSVEVNAMVVAEELGLEYDDVVVDYDYREAFSPVGGGSDGTAASAWAMKECAHIMKKQILEAALQDAENPPPGTISGGTVDPPKAGWVGVNPFKGRGLRPEDLDMVDGRVIVKSDPSVGLPLKEVTTRNLFATYVGMPPVSAWTRGFGKILDTMNTAFCEVAVDAETGEVEVLRFGVAADPGKILRPTSLESQVDQVMYFSQGCQLLEEMIYDDRTGVRLNNNMLDYKKPTMLDVPLVDKTFLETRAGDAAYGAAGISHSLANTHMVIIAIHNAIGVWVDPPATPDKVLKALKQL